MYYINLEGLDYISYRGSMCTTPQGIQMTYKWKCEPCKGTEKDWEDAQSSVRGASLGINEKPTQAKRYRVYIGEQLGAPVNAS